MQLPLCMLNRQAWHAGMRAMLQSRGLLEVAEPDSDEEFWEQTRARPPLAAAQEAALSDPERGVTSMCLSPRCELHWNQTWHSLRSALHCQQQSDCLEAACSVGPYGSSQTLTTILPGPGLVAA